MGKTRTHQRHSDSRYRLNGFFGSRGLVALLLVPVVLGGTIFLTPQDEGVVEGRRTPEPVAFVFTGDVMIGRSVNSGSLKRNEWRWPFLQTAELLRAADFTVVNLETPVLRKCPVRNDGMSFCADQRGLAGLTYAGIDAVSLANNHTYNWGKAGYRETGELLTAQGIDWFGSEVVVRRRIKDMTVSLLGFDDTGAGMNLNRAIELVRQEATQSALVIGILHWGNEYTHTPTARQTMIGHTLVDNGMRLVVGMHPHWTQPVEEYKDGLIFYSLGNFVFDQMWSWETRRGEVARVVVNRERALSFEYELLPVTIYDYGQPRFE